jgi:hypothetical protein
MFVVALVVQVLAQTFGGVWGAAVGGIVTGLLLRRGSAFAVGALSAALAAALLLLMVVLRGEGVMHFAGMIGANFSLPGWALVLVTLLLPALQAGGLAGAVGLLMAPTRSAPPARR